MPPLFNPSAPWTPSLALAWLLAPLAVHVALLAFARSRAAKSQWAAVWHGAAALALGSGIWSLHVLAVFAQDLPQALPHSAGLTLMSWALAVLAGAGVLALAAEHRLAAARMPLAALAFGAGLLATQLVALAAADLAAPALAQPGRLLPAAIVAIAGCALALMLRQRWLPESRRGLRLRDAAVALCWGGASALGLQLVIASTGMTQVTTMVGAEVTGISADVLITLASAGTPLLLGALWLVASVEARLRASLQRSREELAQHAMRDPLTRLPNRTRFEGTLAQAVKHADGQRGALALLLVNIDGLKYINHAGDHRGGDHVLRELAGRLRGAAPAHMVARLGGDEFVVLQPGQARRESASRLATQLLELVSQPLRVGSQELVVTCSIGIAMYPEDGAHTTLISRADMAMRECKRNGGASYTFFEPRMVKGARDQAALLHDLRQAVVRHELELVYQPKVHAPTGEITGAEALLRWNHPRRGLVSPAVFVPVAERFGLIGAIGNWVIEEACRQAREWRDQGLRMRVAINLSPHQLRDPQLGERLESALTRNQINPKLLTCEITESVAMEDSKATAQFFATLARVGVHISIDDFGTGYSSLSTLRKLPAEELKIDRSFVCDLETSADARAVVDAVVKLGHALNLKVVAEGVETEEQNRILSGLGCHQLQGFLFAKPMSAKALALWAMDDLGPRSMMFRPSLFQPTAPSPIH